MTIPVICDRCRATGSSGTGDFAHLGDLLDFTPVPRKMERVDGWNADRQRAFIAALSATGSKRRAALAIGMAAFGVDQLLKAEGSESFKAAFERAMAIAAKAGTMKVAQGVADAAARNAQLTPPSRLRGLRQPLLPGQVYNENGEPEDALSVERRGGEASQRIAGKLLACRRWYLREIADSPGQRAAFEILTGLPIDWAKAKQMEAQEQEPYAMPNMREPDMVLTAENGWLGSIVPTYGPDRIGELREAVNREREKRGLPIVTDWSESAERSDAEGNEARVDEGDSPIRHSRAGGNPAQEETTSSVPEGPPPSRSFGLNSQEFHDAVARPGRRAIIPPRD